MFVLQLRSNFPRLREPMKPRGANSRNLLAILMPKKLRFEFVTGGLMNGQNFHRSPLHQRGHSLHPAGHRRRLRDCPRRRRAAVASAAAASAGRSSPPATPACSCPRPPSRPRRSAGCHGDQRTWVAIQREGRIIGLILSDENHKELHCDYQGNPFRR